MAAVVLLLQLTSHRVGLQGSLGRLAHAQRQLLSKLVEAPAGTKQGQQNSGCMALYSIADLSKFEQAVPATVVREKPEIWLLTCGSRQASHCLDVAVTSTTLTIAILQLQPSSLAAAPVCPGPGAPQPGHLPQGVSSKVVGCLRHVAHHCQVLVVAAAAGCGGQRMHSSMRTAADSAQDLSGATRVL